MQPRSFQTDNQNPIDPMTEIAFILDRSGSMQNLRETAIAGFNDFLREQKAVGTDACFTLVLFDDRYEVPFRSVPLCEVSSLNADSFVPRGTTALLDAIGRTIDELGQRLAALPENQRPTQVVIAVLTDGLENASRVHTRHEIADKIAHQRDKYNWQFYFLAANQDAIASAAKLSIAAMYAATYPSSKSGVAASSRSISRKLSAVRKAAAKAPMSVREKADLSAPLSDIVADEMK